MAQSENDLCYIESEGSKCNCKKSFVHRKMTHVEFLPRELYSNNVLYGQREAAGSKLMRNGIGRGSHTPSHLFCTFATALSNQL